MKKSVFFVLGLVAFLGLSSRAEATSEVQSETDFDVHAEALISKTILFPISSLQKVEQAVQNAAARTGDAMKTEITYDIDPAQHTKVRCADESPIMFEGHLFGCVLDVTIDLGSGNTATLTNMLYLSQSTAEASAVLANTDVNKVDHVELNRIFDGGHGSTYGCNAEGSAGARSWACYLKMID